MADQATCPSPRSAAHASAVSSAASAVPPASTDAMRSARIFYRTDVHQFGSMLAAAPLGADDLANLDLLHAETCAESLRLCAALFAQIALGRAVIELVVSRIAGRARSLGMADQRNMPVAAQRGPCKRSVVGGIGREIGRASCREGG